MLVQNYRGGEKWLDGVITDVLGPVTYLVNVQGICVKRHVNQMLDAKRKKVTTERTVTNTEGNWDDYDHPEDNAQSTDAVADVDEQTFQNSQSSEEPNRALENPASSEHSERLKRNMRPAQQLVF